VAAGPVSRILSALRRDGHSSRPRITARLKRPTRRLWRAEPARAPGAAEALPRGPSLFGLAPCGACPARRITATAVRSYRTFSPLPGPCSPGGMFSVALSVERPAYKSAGVLPDVIRHTALRSSDFPPVLTTPARQKRALWGPRCDERPSGPAASRSIIFDGLRAASSLGASSQESRADC